MLKKKIDTKEIIKVLDQLSEDQRVELFYMMKGAALISSKELSATV
jgi:hypothetical protein